MNKGPENWRCDHAGPGTKALTGGMNMWPFTRRTPATLYLGTVVAVRRGDFLKRLEADSSEALGTVLLNELESVLALPPVSAAPRGGNVLKVDVTLEAFRKGVGPVVVGSCGLPPHMATDGDRMRSNFFSGSSEVAGEIPGDRADVMGEFSFVVVALEGSIGHRQSCQPRPVRRTCARRRRAL